MYTEVQKWKQLKLIFVQTKNLDSIASVKLFEHSIYDEHKAFMFHSRLFFFLNSRRDDFNFPIVNFPFICSNIPAAPAYGVYISQLIRYSRTCGSYQDILNRGLLQARKLLSHGFLLVKLKSLLRKFYDRHHDLVDRYGISVTQMTKICSTCCKHFPALSSFMIYHRFCIQINTTGATSGAGTASFRST